jgi:hypothetical protein
MTLTTMDQGSQDPTVYLIDLLDRINIPFLPFSVVYDMQLSSLTCSPAYVTPISQDSIARRVEGVAVLCPNVRPTAVG